MAGLDRLNIAVTGANGFIGSHLINLLLTLPTEVSGFCGEDLPTHDLAGNVAFTVGDICNDSDVKRFVQGKHTVIHLAGPASVAASFQNSAACVRAHAVGTACLLTHAFKANVQRFIYVSSAEVYGTPTSEFVDECHSLQAKSPYAAAKICGEKLVESYRSSYGLDTLILRPFSIYGPGSKSPSLLSKIIQLARANEPVVLHDLRPIRDYCYVEDVVSAIVLACTSGTPGAIYNIGTMLGTTVKQLAETAVRLLGKDLPVLQADEEIFDRPRNADIVRLVANNKRALKDLLWEPAVNLEGGLERMLSALRE